MAAPLGNYVANRQSALASAMVAGALTTMPRHEATLRGSAASTAIASAADAAAATTPATAAAGAAAVSGGDAIGE